MMQVNKALNYRSSHYERYGAVCIAHTIPNEHLALNISRALCSDSKTLSAIYKCSSLSLVREKRRLRVFENKMLRGIFGPKRDKVTGKWRIFHNEKLTDLYSSANIIRVIKSRRMTWAGHVSRMGESRSAYRVWWGILRKRNHSEDPGVDGRIILRLIFRKWDVGVQMDRSGSGQGQVAGTCEGGN
jgi:hypothetical protein